MEVQLLTAIRESQKRLLPAIKKQKKQNPNKEFFFQFLRIITPLKEIPLSVHRNYRFFLDGKVEPNAKTGAVYREVSKAGIRKDQIWHVSNQPTSKLTIIFRILFRLPWLFLLLSRNIKVFKLFDLAALRIFFGYVGYKRFFTRHESLIPIIISDISPRLHMQWSAARSIKREVFWWQDDYHHYSGFLDENYMPYPCDIAAVLNQKGLETVLQRNPNALVLARSKTKVETFKVIPPHPILGVATNSSFEASPSQILLIDMVRKNMNASNVIVRLHPNSQLRTKDFKETWINVSPPEESLERYCNKVDVVIVGNSAVQLKLLCAGIPIIHTQGLDNLGFDRYGYCSNGYCLGIKDVIHQVTPKMVNLFYQDTQIQRRLKDFVNVREVIPALSKIRQIV